MQTNSEDAVGVTPQPGYCNDQIQSGLQVSVARLATFIRKFETWLFNEFRCPLNAEDERTPDPAELTLALLPWVSALRSLGLNGTLRDISPEQAAKLVCLINHALDQLEKEYVRSGAAAAVMMLALSPVDDILVFLSLAQTKTGRPAIPEGWSQP